MALRIPWDKYETALLIETYLQIESRSIRRNDAIRMLSELLRKRAIKNGIEIDVTFRNENGISRQMGNIQRLMMHLPDAEKHNTKIFADMVELYNNNRSQFNAILTEAKGEMTPVKTNKELFFEWLSKRVSSSQIKSCYLMMADIDVYARKKDLFNGSIWDVKTSVTTRQLLEALRKDRVFRFFRRGTIQQITELARWFHEYTLEKEHPIQENQSAPSHKQSSAMLVWRKQIKESVPLNGSDETAIPTTNEHMDETTTVACRTRKENTRIIQSFDSTIGYDTVPKNPALPEVHDLPDLNEDCDRCIEQTEQTQSKAAKMKYTLFVQGCSFLKAKNISADVIEESFEPTWRPLSVSYFGEKKDVSSWGEVYVTACRFLYDDYPDVFKRHLKAGFCVFRNGLEQEKLATGLYVSSRYSAEKCLSNLSFLLEACLVDEENVVIQSIIETADPVLAFLHYHSIEFIDKRDKYGSLWIVGVPIDSEYIRILKQAGIALRYAEYGGKATRWRPAWYTKDNTENIRIDALGELLHFSKKTVISSSHTEPSDKQKNETSLVEQSTQAGKPIKTRTESYSPINTRQRFIHWMQRRGFASSTSNGYASAISSLDRFALSHGLLETSIFEIDNLTLLDASWAMLQANKAFSDFDRHQHRRFTAAMKQYLPFARKQLLMESGGDQNAVQPKPVNLPEVPPTTQREQKSIKKPETRQSSSNVVRTPEHLKQANIKPGKHAGRQEFETWLEGTGCPRGTIKTYADSVERISSFLLERRLEDRSLFSIRGVGRLEDIRASLHKDKEFFEYAKEHRGGHLELYALKKYIDFRTGGSDEHTNDTLSEEFSALLQECFSNGFRLNSIIDRNRLKQYYQDRFGKPLEQEDQQILDRIKKLGTIQENRVFYHKGSGHSNLIDDIQAKIASTFNQGASCIYYTELFRRYQDVLAAQVQVYNEETLKNLLIQSSYGEYLPGKYYFYRKSMSTDADSDIRAAMRSSTLPLTYEQLQKRLWYLPQDRIKRCLLQTPDLVNVDKGAYFDARNLPVNNQELIQITRLIHRQLTQKDFLTDAELRDLIRRDCPSVAINTEGFTTWGLRNCLAVLLSGQFSFNGPIVSEVGRELNMGQAFAQFSQSHELMTLDDLKQFAKEVNKNIIYWDSVMNVMVRISQNEFVPKTSMDFDVEAIDHVLDELFEGDYAPLKCLNLFFQYPAISVRWNIFVLESYIAGFSRKFELLHSGYTVGECCGAVVRREANITDFQTLVTDVLAHNGQWNSKNDALTLLVREGYLQRKNYAKIDTILPQAKLLREKNATGM